MSFINNANQIIGDNMRFLQQFKANPQASQSQSTTSSAADTEMQMLMPMMMLMMFQLLSNMNNSAGSGQSTAANLLDPYQGLAGTQGYLPFPPPQAPPVSASTSTGAEQWIQQNPAYQFLTSQLSGSGTTISSAIDPSANPPNFGDNGSLANRMTALLTDNPDADLKALPNQLLNGTLNADDSDQFLSQMQDKMVQQGYSDQSITELGILFGGMQNNNQLLQAQNQAATNPSTENSQLVDQLTQNQTQLSQDWQALYANGLTAGSTSSDSQVVLNALTNGQFTGTQLGQSLKYMWDTSSESSLDNLSGLTANLMKSGALNIIPFLDASYLDRLTPERQQSLLSAVENAGLTMSDGTPNSRFAGYLLQNLAQPGISSTKSFLWQFLQDDWLANGSDTSSGEGKVLSQVLGLAGIQGTAGQPLVSTI